MGLKYLLIMDTFTDNYIIPDMLVSGGSLPLQNSMKALAKGFYDFYSTTGWQGFIFMIFPVCGLLGLIALSQKLANGDETWGRGCSNFIWKVMLAVAVLYVAPNSPKYMTELVNQTVASLRGTSPTPTTSEVLKHSHVNVLLYPAIQAHNVALLNIKNYTDPIIQEYSAKNSMIYGHLMSFEKVTSIADENGHGLGFLNVNVHMPSMDSGSIPASTMTPQLQSLTYPNGTVYEMKTWPVDEAIEDTFLRLEGNVQDSLNSGLSSAMVQSEIRNVWMRRFIGELALIRRYFLNDYINYLLMEKRMAYYDKGATPKVMAKLNKVFSEKQKAMYEDLLELEEKTKEDNKLSDLPGVFFDFSMIFISIYVTFTIYLLPIVLPLWAAMFMLPESFQLSQSLKKGMSLLITIWLLPVFLDLIILVGNALTSTSPETSGTLTMKIMFATVTNDYDAGLAKDMGSLAINVIGGFVSMMLIIAAPLIVNKLVSGSSAFIETVTSAGQQGAAVGGAVVMAGGSAVVGIGGGAASILKGSSGAVGAAGAAAKAVGGAGSAAADNLSTPGPMDSA
jgi:hypothetical protein